MWLLMLGLFVTPAVFSTLVLCVGGTDHVAMETSHAPSTQHGDDGPCLDVPVLVAAEKSSRIDSQLSPALDDLKLPLAPHALLMPSKADARFRRPWHCDLSVCDPTLPSLRTIIILT